MPLVAKKFVLAVVGVVPSRAFVALFLKRRPSIVYWVAVAKEMRPANLALGGPLVFLLVLLLVKVVVCLLVIRFKAVAVDFRTLPFAVVKVVRQQDAERRPLIVCVLLVRLSVFHHPYVVARNLFVAAGPDPYKAAVYDRLQVLRPLLLVLAASAFVTLVGACKVKVIKVKLV